jgi:photosystem II stability/assembly factor-like uncharacterized protein
MIRRLAATALCFPLILCPQAEAQTASTGPWQLQTSTTKASLRGIHTVDSRVAWASGTNGAILRTEDGGNKWQSCAMPPGAEKLDFRGVWAWDANTAVAMSSGPGDLSRLYKTTDGCSSWKLLYTNPDKDGFWDAIAFTDRANGILLGDPIPLSDLREVSSEVTTPLRYFGIFSTDDGGASWRPWNQTLRETNGNPSIFAASNSSLWAMPSRREPWYLFGTGGVTGPSIFRLVGTPKPADSRPSITAVELLRSSVPLASGNDSSGVFSLAFRDQNHGVAVGGDYKKPHESQGTAAWTNDGGKTWTAAAKPPHGYRSAVAWDAGDKAQPEYWIAAGTNGSDISYDDGKTWQPLDNGNWNALSLPWVVGPDGRIAKLVSLKPAVTSGK